MNENGNSTNSLSSMPGSRSLPPPPIFSVLGGDESKIGKNGIISLVDIFDEFLFAPDRALATSANSAAENSKSSNSKNQQQDNSKDKHLNANFKREKEMDHHDMSRDDMMRDDDDGDYDSFDGDDGDGFLDDNTEDGKKRKRARGIQRNMTEVQKVERRERNREHAKRSRVRKKFLLESLQHSVHALEEENEKLRSAIREHLEGEADEFLKSCTSGGISVIATDPNNATKTLDDPDYSLVKALQTAQQNFVISDPSLPDNPIVYASQGFLTLTGYTLDKVLGRNCRFLQGPDTDPKAVDRIRKGIEKGEDTTVCLLNYRIDGTTFWNQFFIAALRDGDGNVVNYLGVQCKVSEEYAKAFVKNEEYEEQVKK
mmetsp:Transcript_29835/g.40990  ORF Transcript_29835/g.40990 Transcript_29835/m.40990 type:complete len:371 (-) Transcript_29835:129-1241(-)